MGSKAVSISMPESFEWKLAQLENKTGMPRSRLVQKALLLLFEEMESYTFPGGQLGCDKTEEDIDEEYQSVKQQSS